MCVYKKLHVSVLTHFWCWRIMGACRRKFKKKVLDLIEMYAETLDIVELLTRFKCWRCSYVGAFLVLPHF